MKKKVAFSLDENLLKKLKEISEQTMIPQSRLVESALKEVIIKYRGDK